MQTIRIYAITQQRGYQTMLTKVWEVSGPANKVETDQLREKFPEAEGFLWLR